MEYNSQKELLVMPEYGRNIQQMVRYAQGIQDDQERQAFVEKIVELMMQMNPQSRNMDDYVSKLWKHVFRIANFEIDVVDPKGNKPNPEDASFRPEIIPYPHGKTRYKHYGNNVQEMIDKAVEMEEEPVQQGFAHAIASYMKMAYKTWHKEHYVNDDLIKQDLEKMSKGKLKLPEDMDLDFLGNGGGPSGGSGGSKRKHRGSSRHSNRGRKGGSKRKRH